MPIAFAGGAAYAAHRVPRRSQSLVRVRVNSPDASNDHRARRCYWRRTDQGLTTAANHCFHASRMHGGNLLSLLIRRTLRACGCKGDRHAEHAKSGATPKGVESSAWHVTAGPAHWALSTIDDVR